MELRVILTNSADEKLQALARRRYGDTESSITLTICDALNWQLDRWRRYEIGIRDYIWLKLAFSGPIPWLRAKAWGKLIEPYFERAEE